MEPVVFRYRSREFTASDIAFIKETITAYSAKGRTQISQVLCRAWSWVQPNGQLKEYAARDLLLRLEEKGLIALPPRIKKNNNLYSKSFGSVEKRRPALSNCPPIYGNNSFSKKLNHKVGGQYGC